MSEERPMAAPTTVGDDPATTAAGRPSPGAVDAEPESPPESPESQPAGRRGLSRRGFLVAGAFGAAAVAGTYAVSRGVVELPEVPGVPGLSGPTPPELRIDPRPVGCAALDRDESAR